MAALAALLAAVGAWAEDASEDSVKAGFLLNFAKYTEWPGGTPAGREFLVCSLGPRPLSGKLELLQGRPLQGREIRVRTAVRPSEWRDCQLLFVAADEAQRAGGVAEALAPHPVLTIGETPGFAQAGGIIGLKLRAGRVRFDINQGAARRAGLTLSSQLLKLADEVLQ